MHPALLIDEIIQLIFETLLNDEKPALCVAARCCQAWKDPALDRIWRRLPSASPLLSLFPNFPIENDNIRLGRIPQDVSVTVFRSYAVRVKHIVHSHRVPEDLTSVPMHFFHQLNNLESARIEHGAIGEAALRMSLAPRLQALTLQVGYAKPNSVSMTVHCMLSLLQGCSSLEQLSVRGYSSECLQTPLSNITTLRSLSLHLSSLTEQSFMTASTFPFLVDFDVHADRLSHDYLSAAIARSCDIPFFPALERLKIRTQPALLALIVQQLPRDKLCFLHLDATGSTPPLAFEGLFQAMAAFPLHDFTLEHTISDDESENTPMYTPDKVFTLDHFRPLSKLPLRQFMLDSSLPPDLSDSSIEELTKWWPHLERLGLGAPTALENTEMIWKPRSSLASLSAVAKGCKNLNSLVVTLDVDSAQLSLLDPGPDPHPLTSLSISSRSRTNVPSLSIALARLFPSLVNATLGYVGDHEGAWATIQVTGNL